MAKLFFANEGSIEFMPETMSMLRGLPKHWRVILNARPADSHHTREIDALVITERALHVVEFKYRSKPVTISSEGCWRSGGRDEPSSPAIQARDTADAFKTWLDAHPNLRHMRNAVVPWVVLERFDPENRIGTESMRPGRYYDPGYAKVLNGITGFQDALRNREKYESKRVSPYPFEVQDVEAIINTMGAKRLDALTVQGRVLDLKSGQPLQGVPVRFVSQHTSAPFKGFATEVLSDENGHFAVTEAPIAPFDVRFVGADHLPGWTSLPTVTFHPRTSYTVVNVYLASPNLDEEHVQNLLAQQLSGVKADISDLQTWLLEHDEKQSQQAKRIQELEELVQQLSEGQPEMSVDLVDLAPVWQELENLRAEQQKFNLLEEVDLQLLAEDALAPVKQELLQLSQRVAQVEGRLNQTEAGLADVRLLVDESSLRSQEAEKRADTAAQQASGAHQRVDDLEGRFAGVSETAQAAAKVADQAGQRASQAYRISSLLENRVEDVYGTAQAARQQADSASAQSEAAASSAAESAQSAQSAQESAADSAAESQRAANEARESRWVQDKRFKHEQEIYTVNEERRKKRAEALKLSAIIGAAGGMVSMQPIPFADNVILTPMQIWMVVRIGQIYGQSIGQDVALKLIGTMGFGFAAQHATIAVYKLVPGLTFGLGPFTVFGFTVLLGAATAIFYERGHMPDKREQGQLLQGIKNLLQDKEFADEVKAMGVSAAQEFKARCSKPTAENLQAVFATVSERARPIGERLEGKLFGKDGRA